MGKTEDDTASERSFDLQRNQQWRLKGRHRIHHRPRPVATTVDYDVSSLGRGSATSATGCYGVLLCDRQEVGADRDVTHGGDEAAVFRSARVAANVSSN